MDGHFVPNISFGAPVIAGLSKVCDLPFDVHLMISQPLRYIDDYADAGADLQNDVAVIVRVARQQQHTQLLLELRAAGTAEIDLLARDLVQLGVAQQRLRLRDLRLTGGIRPVGLHDRLQLALLAAELCEHRGVGIIRGVGQLALQLAVPVFNLSQLFEHGAASLVAIFAQCISLPQRRKNVNRRCVCAHRLSEDLRLFTRAG